MTTKSYIDEKVREFEKKLLNVARLADEGDDKGYGTALFKLCGDIETTLKEAYSKGREEGAKSALKDIWDIILANAVAESEDTYFVKIKKEALSQGETKSHP